MEHPVRSTLELEQYECQNCKRLFYINVMDRDENDQILCPYGCSPMPYHGAGKHIRTLRTEVKEVIELDISRICLKGKYVIMKTKAALNLDIIDRVYFCKFGHGCNPEASGTKVYGHFVTDPEKVYMRRYDVVRLATEDEVKQAQERFRKNKTWALQNWRKHLVDSKKTVLDVLIERGGFE